MKTHLIWFRNDLRTIDNIVLQRASSNAEKLLAVYCFDPRHFAETSFGFKKTERYRAQFLIETVVALQKELAALNITLIIAHDTPENTLNQIVQEHHITDIFYQKEWTSEEKLVENKVKQSVPSKVIYHSYYNQFLFHPKDIPYTSPDTIPEVFTSFRKKVEVQTTVRKEVSMTKMDATNILKETFSPPTLAQLGLETPKSDSRSAFPFKGGTAAALERIQSYFWKEHHLQQYKQTRNGLIGLNYSSKLSPWLANGSISPRTIYWEVQKFEKKAIKNQDTYWLIFELLWRDYFKYISLKHQDAIFHQGGILKKKYDWGTNNKTTLMWIEGKTPYSFVNANMKELALTGWMSNRGRQNVASYWSKELEQDWRIGAAYFESLLIDYDVHSNWCNWMYGSGVGNDPRDRKFNIERQAKMYDANHEYVRLWGEL